MRAQQQALAERLGDVVVGAHRQAGFLVLLLVLAGEEDHRQLGRLAQPPQQLHPVHARHLDIEDREVGRVLAQRLQRGLAVRIDARRIAFGLQRNRQRGQDVAVVVDQRDAALALAGGGGGEFISTIAPAYRVTPKETIRPGLRFDGAARADYAPPKTVAAERTPIRKSTESPPT
jgi:hypothetical protein